MEDIEKKLSKYIIEAERGRETWIQLCEKYNIESKTLVLLMPEHEWKYNEIALRYVDQYCKKKELCKKLIITVDKKVVDVFSNYCEDATVIQVNEAYANEIMQFYCLYNFTPNLIIASLDKPFGRKGKGSIDKNGLSLEKVAAAMWFEIYL